MKTKIFYQILRVYAYEFFAFIKQAAKTSYFINSNLIENILKKPSPTTFWCVGFGNLFKNSPQKELPKPPVAPVGPSATTNTNITTTPSKPNITTPVKNNTVETLPNPKKKAFYVNEIKTSVLQNTALHKTVPLNALQKNDSVSLVPWTKNCPPYMLMQNYSDFCNLAAGKHCLQQGEQIKNILPMMFLARGNPGENITALASISKGIPEFQEPIPFDHHFSPEQLKLLNDAIILDLSNISLKTQAMLTLEIFSMLQINSQLANYELQFTQEMPVENKTNFVNNTPNSRPDYALVPRNADFRNTNETVISFDLKFTKKPYIGKNIVLGVTDNQAPILMMLHEKLIKQITEVIPKLSGEDIAINLEIQKKLTSNLQEFSETNNITTFRTKYNLLYEMYINFFLTQKIGFNFVADLSLNNFNISENEKKLFLDYYKYYYLEEHGEVAKYVSHIPEYNPYNKGEHYHNLLDFWHEIFSQK